MTTVLELPKKRGGGRPPMRQDNRRVQSFLSEFMKTSELMATFPVLDDVFSGAVNAQTEGEAHTRPLSKAKLFRVLRWCEVIETSAVASVLAVGYNATYGKSTTARYTAAARVASMAIARLLETYPAWEDAEEEVELLAA